MSEKHNSGSSFFLGIVLGVLITLLFTTKKGRNILKTLADEGVGSLEDFLQPNEDDFAGDEIPSTGESDLDGEKEEKKESNGRKRVFRGLRKN